jgi:hypothetical protein
MAYKSPIELAESLTSNEKAWKPSSFKQLKNPLNGGGQWWEFEDGDYKGQAKLYDTPSEYGINEGRVSKFQLNHKGKPILNYDRGWDTPDGKFKLDPQHQEFYDKILSFLDAYGLDLD